MELCEKMGYHAVILGGGFAGIAAAIQLANAGLKICLIEKKKFLGGRVYSIPDRKTGDCIDNGQHVLMGCYHETFNLLKLLGTDYTVELQPQLNVQYRGPNGYSDALACPALPGPLHLLGGLFKMKTLSLKDQWAVLRFGLKVKSPVAVQLGETVGDFFNRTKQPLALRKIMWDPIVISALNLKPEDADMSLFAEVLRQAFFGAAKDSSLGLPVAALGAMHGEAAIQYIQDRGGSVLFGKIAEKIMIENNQVQSVFLRDSERIQCESCISAMPSHALRQLITQSGLEQIIPIPELGSSAIVSVYLWFEQKFSDDKVCCLQDCQFEWIFHRNNFVQHETLNHYSVCLVMSAADAHLNTPRQDIIDLAIEDVYKVYPEAKDQKIVSSTLFWEPKATFAATPANNLLRPSHTTNIPNFFLAGDWTQTHLPATIEGAVRSGNRAADALLMRNKDYDIQEN